MRVWNYSKNLSQVGGFFFYVYFPYVYFPVEEMVNMKKTMPKTYKGKPTKLGGGGRFQMIVDKARKSGATNPEVVAAAIGRKKYGVKKMAKMAAAGRKKK